MFDGIFVKTYPAPTVDRREILRYAGCQQPIDSVERVLDECLAECENALAYRVCYRVLTAENFYRIFGTHPRLDGCAYAVVFAATVGLDIDRLIARYRQVSVTKSVLLQAIGAERCIYVGDSEVDVLTAKNAGVPCLSVLWGFRDWDCLVEAGATHFCSDPAELLNSLKAMVK